MIKGESIFSVEAVKREKEQAEIEKKVIPENELKPEFEKKVPMNITLPPDYKAKLQEYARKKRLSASIVIQMWIDEFCG